ncbi:hypothetical protein CTEN210_12645 [Chaetoceros tenuissimus]|uniref:Peptidase M11 gametolysin domain-containing protein n=1 Tax=Chaetoceros tenuissimus TaxID=426638 RepID=A0AAD3D1U8_9STRA|nr:hypothetical protein CTEN210_12645 [Chaetoceros tenuissimus]
MKSFQRLLAISVLLFSPEMFMAAKSNLRKTIEDNGDDTQWPKKNLDATGQHSSTGDGNLRRLANGYNIFSIESNDSNLETEAQYLKMGGRKDTNVFSKGAQTKVTAGLGPKECPICSETGEACCGTCIDNKNPKHRGCFECIGSIVDVQYEDGTDDQFMTCENSNGKNYKVTSVDEDFIKNNFGRGKHMSGEADLIFDPDDITIDDSKGKIDSATDSQPILKKKKKCNNGRGHGSDKYSNNGKDKGQEKEKQKEKNDGKEKTCKFDDATTIIASTPGLSGRRLQTQEVVGNCGTYVGGSCAGTRTVLVVRVNAADKSTTADESQLAESIFENRNDSLNLQSWYKQCSYNQLNFEPATGVGINGGVTTVNVTSSSTDGDSVMNNDIAAALNTKFNVTSPNQIANHIMYCLPPGTMNGIAYANVNNWRSVYSDNWCTYVSAQAHEIGHNLMLAHSGDPAGTGSQATYGDKSGMMGFSYSNDDGPIQCFNAPKNWQLGWYDDKRVPVSYDGWEGNLIGLSDYGNSNVAAGDMVIARVNLNESYYVSFNRKTGINSGTQEGGDQVMVHKRELGTEYAASDVLAYLNSGDAYTSPDSNFTVTVNSIDLTSNPARANVKIERFDTPPPCYTGTVTVVINPDPYPGETSWDITDDAENVLASGGSTGASNIVLGDGYYTFSIYDSYGDGICCQFGSGSYTLQVGSTFEVTGGEFDSIESTTFGICNNVSPTAAPTNAPTVAPTKSPTPNPTVSPTNSPSSAPSNAPTVAPTQSPTPNPTVSPTNSPSPAPTNAPTAAPTKSPTPNPTISPTNSPSASSSLSPSILPSSGPSLIESARPSSLPSSYPSLGQSAFPSSKPSIIYSLVPSVLDSVSPTIKASSEPSSVASSSPSKVKSSEPSMAPSDSPSISLVPTAKPSTLPSIISSLSPSILPSSGPSLTESARPSSLPSSYPSLGQSAVPSSKPSIIYSLVPSVLDSVSPTIKASSEPSSVASSSPSKVKSSEPSMAPSDSPSVAVSLVPTAKPSTLASIPSSSLRPSILPSSGPSLTESASPSSLPSSYPSLGQSAVPSSKPSIIYSLVPSVLDSVSPTIKASSEPSSVASSSPSKVKSSEPSMAPSDSPSISLVPTAKPSTLPSITSSSLRPSILPSSGPSLIESASPSSLPSSYPSLGQSTVPSSKPSIIFSLVPSVLDSVSPTIKASSEPSSAPFIGFTSSPINSDVVPTSTPPTPNPTSVPTPSPTSNPSQTPTKAPTSSPVSSPSSAPSKAPFPAPTSSPTSVPTKAPTSAPVTPPPTPSPTSAPTSPPVGFDCFKLSSRKGRCKRKVGCAFNIFTRTCITAPTTAECVSFNNKKRKCKKSGCSFKGKTRKCSGFYG